MKELYKNAFFPEIDLINPKIIRSSKVTGYNDADPEQPFPQRTIHAFELEYIIEGAGSIVVNGIRYQTISGNVFVRTPGMIVQGFPPYQSYCIIWEDLSSSLSAIKEQYSKGAMKDTGIFIPCLIPFSRNNQIQLLFNNVYQKYLASEPGAQIHMKADLLKIMYYIVTFNSSIHVERLKTEGTHYHNIHKMKQFIEDNLGRQLNLAELADICNLSGGSLCRLFKKTNGMTLFTYINRCRMRKARHLLIETDFSIKEISAQCGCENESYFYRMFRMHSQMSPLTYRSIHRPPYGDNSILDD
jgi:AraC-like DNA-binding protein